MSWKNTIRKRLPSLDMKKEAEKFLEGFEKIYNEIKDELDDKIKYTVIMEINNTKKQIRMQSKESYAVDESSRVYQAVMYLTEYVAEKLFNQDASNRVVELFEDFRKGL
mgnify:CR=1 FL=1|tara:strand:- start:99 stop:425 length:327 start_codon:yes stop_codon:yes gene_type:complete